MEEQLLRCGTAGLESGEAQQYVIKVVRPASGNMLVLLTLINF